MNPIEFISAGAGSGKTYRLVSILAESLADGSARAGGVTAMTFTLKAAAELRQRARGALLERGRLDLATAIGQARIGTVNAVCSQLLQRHCFELGAAPQQTVLAEAQSELLLRHALDDTLDEPQREALLRYGERFAFERGDWDKPVQNLVDAARANGIGAEALRAMGGANAAAMLAHWPQPQGDGAALTRALCDAAQQLLQQLQAHVAELRASGAEPLKTTARALDELGGCARRLAQGNWSWRDWAALESLEAGARFRALVAPVVEAAAQQASHPELHADIRAYLVLAFGLAADALARYEAAKRSAGAQDFIDQELLLLRALHENATVRAAMAEELDLVLVDEFQDTSPIQLAVFVELAKLAKRSVWVGDPKQAIYGFRGSDASLIAAVLEAIPAWGGQLGVPLSQSRRSIPALVELTNELFGNAFRTLGPDAVALAPVRAAPPQAQPALVTWSFDSSGARGVFEGLGPAIAGLLASGLQVQDRRTKAWRRVEPGDIAVLCRTNADIPQVAAAMHAWNLPCISSRPGLLATPEALLVLACLRRLHDARDTAATALIVSLSDGVAASEWLADRLRHLQSDQQPSAWRAGGATAHPLVARMEALRPRLAALTPLEALSLAQAESGVWRAAAQWSATPQEAAARVANVEALLRMAAAYEDACASTRRPATVSGLLQWLAAQAAAGKDLRAAAGSAAIEVLTQHSAKGLEWPVVVLTGLDAPARSGLWDVRSRSDGAFDAREPLARRFVHYWPRPYGARRIPNVLRAVQESPLGRALQAQALDEHVRLLYVSCTRARDALALALHERPGARAWLDEIKAAKLLLEGGDETSIPLRSGHAVPRLQQRFSADDIRARPQDAAPGERRWFVERGTAAPAALPLWLRPSAAAADAAAYRVHGVETVGQRIEVRGRIDMGALGSALHHCIAAVVAAPDDATAETVRAILARWQVGPVVKPDAVLAQARALRAWAAAKWGAAPLHVELPLEVRLESGRIARGQVDLLVETSDGWILVDHKADPNAWAHDDRLAQAHGAQLDVYAEAVARATGRPVLQRWLFLPVAAQAVQVVAAEPSR